MSAAYDYDNNLIEFKGRAMSEPDNEAKLAYKLHCEFHRQLRRLLDDKAYKIFAALEDWGSEKNDGWCWYAQSTIAKECNMSTRSVLSAINQLEKAGLVEVQERPGQSSYYRTLRPTSEKVAELTNLRKFCVPTSANIAQPPTQILRTNVSKLTVPIERLDDDEERPPTPVKREDEKASYNRVIPVDRETLEKRKVLNQLTALLGGLNSLTAEKADDLIEDFGSTWLSEACEVAAEHNGRSLAYVRSILERCRKEKTSPKQSQANRLNSKSKDYRQTSPPLTPVTIQPEPLEQRIKKLQRGLSKNLLNDQQKAELEVLLSQQRSHNGHAKQPEPGNV
jgi:DNA-binding transcriptional ArsR family regulator